MDVKLAPGRPAEIRREKVGIVPKAIRAARRVQNLPVRFAAAHQLARSVDVGRRADVVRRPIPLAAPVTSTRIRASWGSGLTLLRLLDCET